MFLHLSVSVILFTGGGGVCLSTYWDTHPPGRLPLGRHPSRQTPHPGQTPPQQTATAADGTHPTGMLSCLSLCKKLRSLGRSGCECQDNASSSGKNHHQSRNFPLYNSLALEIQTASIHIHVFIPQASYIMHWIHIFMTDIAEFFQMKRRRYTYTSNKFPLTGSRLNRLWNYCKYAMQVEKQPCSKWEKEIASQVCFLLIPCQKNSPSA